MARIIVAVARNGVIGCANGTIPWIEREDLKNFRKLTMDPAYGKTLIVGRKTADTLPGLGGRTILVATRHAPLDITRMACLPCAVGTLDALLTQYPGAWIAGGGEVYREAIRDPRVDEAWVTHIPYDVEGEITFPLEEFHRAFVQNGTMNSLASSKGGSLSVVHYQRHA